MGSYDMKIYTYSAQNYSLEPEPTQGHVRMAERESGARRPAEVTRGHVRDLAPVTTHMLTHHCCMIAA